jgi:hypothetical protein
MIPHNQARVRLPMPNGGEREFDVNAPVGAVAWDHDRKVWLYDVEEAMDLQSFDLGLDDEDGGRPGESVRVAWADPVDGGMPTGAHPDTQREALAALTYVLRAAWRDGVEIGGLVSAALTAVAREVGGTDQLVRYRPGSWEAEDVRHLALGADVAT